MGYPPEFDDIDEGIVRERVEALDTYPGPRPGDFVDFADGVNRRISHVYSREHWGEDWGVQTSDGGSWYLGDGWVDFSGSLYPAVPGDTLTLTRDHRAGQIWVFHHDKWMAHNGVSTYIDFRVYRSSREAPR